MRFTTSSCLKAETHTEVTTSAVMMVDGVWGETMLLPYIVECS